jgi:hypothetical protein
MFFNFCCCDQPPVDCNIYTDTFASNLLATKWIQVAGSWSVAGGQLVPSATGDLIVTVDQDATTPAIYGQFASLPIFYGDSPAKVRLIVDYVDADNYHFATAVCGALSSTVEVGKRVAGADTILATKTASHSRTIAAGQRSLQCCFDSTGRLRATLTVYPFGPQVVSVSKVGETWLGGRKGGVQAQVYAADLKFEEFIFKHLTRGPFDICATCGVECETQTGSPLRFATFCDDAYPAPGSIIVDLGVTGITDGLCDCDWITGAFVCDRTADCGFWAYNSGPRCLISPDGCNPAQNINFRINVANQLRFSDPNQRRFYIVMAYEGGVRNPACPSQPSILIASYYTPWTTAPEHCSLAVPVVATTTTDPDGGGGTALFPFGRCNGLLPTSVTLSA